MKNKMYVYSIMHTTKVVRWLTILMNCISVLDLECFLCLQATLSLVNNSDHHRTDMGKSNNSF